MAIIETINSAINTVVWGKPMLVLLVGAGILLTIRTFGVQFRKFGYAMKNTAGKIFKKGEAKEGEITPFQAMSTALAGTVGTGNIAGVTTALTLGGPGSMFWLWITALIGMATKYSEVLLAVKFRERNKDGDWVGGPMYYIKNGLGKNWKWLGAIFCIFAALAAFGIGNAVQVGNITSSINTVITSFSPDFAGQKMVNSVLGIILVILTAIVLFGGIKRLGAVTEKLVPIMAAIFLLGALVVLAIRIQYIPETFGMIFKYAFNPNAIIGGGLGYALKTAISQGVKRGLFSNEAGMGSTPHAHALANVKCPHDQGVVAMIGVFIDTFVVLTLNALVIISTLYTEGGPLHECGAAAASTTLGKANLAQTAFGVVFGETAGNMFVAVCMFFFAFSTILGWNLFGKINVAYLFGKKSVIVYTILALIFIFLGTMMANDLVWELSDMFNNLMVIPNVIALFALTNLVVKHADDPSRIPGKK